MRAFSRGKSLGWSDGSVDDVRDPAPAVGARAWIVALVLGGFASSKLSAILSNTFSVPGTQSEQVREVLQQHFGDRSDGAFTVVFALSPGAAANPVATRASLTAAVKRAAAVVPSGSPADFNIAHTPGGTTVVYGDVDSTLDLAEAKGYTDEVRAALGRPPGVSQVYVTGAAAIQHDLDPVFNRDLKHGELLIAVPIALLVLLFVFGLSWAVTIPLVFAACTISATLGIVYGVASVWATPTYATNLVQLIGLGIAVDYSLLIVYRFREELSLGKSEDDAIVRTMRDGRARRRLLGDRGRARARAARRDAAAVHPDARRRRLPDPDRLDPRRRDAPAGAAQLLRPPRDGAAQDHAG